MICCLKKLDCMETKQKFKILVIDGGGIKGLYSASVLAELEKCYNIRLTDYFDLICGTSTGGLLALGASLGIPMEEIVNFYIKRGPEIFSEKRPKSFLKKYWLKFKQALLCSKYRQQPLKKALIDVFQDKKLKDSNNLICIPSIDINVGRARVFKKDYDNLRTDDELSYVDVALATTAAPTYFPIHEICGAQYVDGGIWANNPIEVALYEYLYKFADDERFDGVEILSISSFEVEKGETYVKKLNRSFFKWSDTLFDAYSSLQSKFSMQFLDKLRPSLKFSLNVQRVTNIASSAEHSKLSDMDNASPCALKTLKTIGKRTGAEYQSKPEIEHFFKTKKTIILK